MSVATVAAPPRTGGLEYKWKVLITVIFGIFMVILDSTVVNVAFRTLQRELGASVNDSQWVISIYVLALGISTPLAGFLADRFGLKRMYLGGLCAFVLGSLMCGFAPNLWTLIVARGIQGFGGGVALPLGTALLFSAFPAEEQGTALGIFGIALVVAPALGPILGGLLVDHNHWRWIFFINVPIGIVGVTLGSLWLRHRPAGRRPRLDVLGLLTSMVGFGAILYAASMAGIDGWGSPSVFLWFLLGVAGLCFFALVELYIAPEPLLNLRLYQQRTFLIASLVGYVSVVALFGAEFLLPLYLQAARGYTALQTGFILLPLALAAGVTTPIAGKLYDKVGPRPLVTIGFTVLAINTWQLSLIKADTTIQWIAFLLVLRGFALGMTVQTTFVTALSVVPGRQIARGSSLTNATRQVAQAIAVALLATILTSTLSPEVRAMAAQFQQMAVPAGQPAVVLCDPATYPTGPRQGLGGATGAPASLVGAPPPAVSALGAVAQAGGPPPGVSGAPPTGGGVGITAILMMVCQQTVAGFERAYQITFLFSLLALLLGMTLPGWPFKWAGRRAADGPPGGAPPPAH